MTEYVRQLFGSIRNYWTGSSSSSSDLRAGSRNHHQARPQHSSYFPNNNISHQLNNNNNFSIFPRKRKRSAEQDDPSMMGTKLSEKEEYKKLVESMQNGFHANGGSSYSNSKIPRIQPTKVNGVSHNRISTATPAVIPGKRMESAYFSHLPVPVPKPSGLPPGLLRSRQSHAHVKSVFADWDVSMDDVAEVQAAHKSTVKTVDDVVSSRFKTKTSYELGRNNMRSSLIPMSNLSQQRNADRIAAIYSIRPWVRSNASRQSNAPVPEVINLTGDDDVEVISPPPKIFTSTPRVSPTPTSAFAFPPAQQRQEFSSTDTPASPTRQEFSSTDTPASPTQNETTEDPVFVRSDSEDDPDIQVLSESIISPKNNQYQINSLELETRQSIYRQKAWLSNSTSEYRENRKHRDEQIGFERKKMAILKHESDLPNDIEARIRMNLTITDIIVLEPEEVALTLPPITAEMRQIINHAVTGRESEVIVTAFSIQITRGDLRTLAPCKWLNDNVINTYMDMIALRSKEGKFPKVHVFSTFFYPKFLKEGYSNILKRWTRKVDIFTMDLIIFPIHLGIHWCLAVADLRNKSIKFYDSLLGQQTRCLEALFSYLSSEMKERKKTVLNRSEWTTELMKDIPTQENGSDCGVFACKFAEYLSRDAKLTFKQKDMDYYRDRMVYEIVKQDLLYP